jgi:hypothetical protein
MADFLAEQMRSLVRRLDELTQADTMPAQGLEGTINPKQLADMLGISDLNTFTISINKIRQGDTDKLTIPEMTEMAVAFVNLLAAEAEDTQKVMQSLKRVSAKSEPMMEGDGATWIKHPDGSRFVNVSASDKPGMYTVHYIQNGQAGTKIADVAGSDLRDADNPSKPFRPKAMMELKRMGAKSDTM